MGKKKSEKGINVNWRLSEGKHDGGVLARLLGSHKASCEKRAFS